MSNSSRKAAVAWSEVSIAALSAREICTDLIGDHIPRESITAHVVSLSAIVEKIGYIADLHSGEDVFEDASKWFLPPGYRLGEDGNDELDVGLRKKAAVKANLAHPDL